MSAAAVGVADRAEQSTSTLESREERPSSELQAESTPEEEDDDAEEEDGLVETEREEEVVEITLSDRASDKEARESWVGDCEYRVRVVAW